MEHAKSMKWMLAVVAGVLVMATAAVAQDAPADAAPPDNGEVAGGNGWADGLFASDMSLDELHQQTTHPVEWFTWGADLRLREIFAPNLIFNNANFDDDPLNRNRSDSADWHFQRYRARTWATVSPTEDIDLNARLVFEPRHWCTPESKDNRDHDEALLDVLNVTWRKPFDIPATFVVGRQNIRLGDAWLVFEGTPLDGSRTIYFDAVRATWDFTDYNTRVDTIWIDQHADTDRWLEPINDQNVHLTEQDEKGVIVYVSNTSLESTIVDGYFISKHMDALKPKDRGRDADGDGFADDSDEGDIYTFGTRVVHDFDDNWKARGELAYQFGNKNGEDHCALGFNGRLSYFLNDKWNNNFRIHYEYLSGDDPDSDRSEAFDPLWGRWPQWSELYIYNYAIETRIAEITNLHRIGLGWTFHPTEQLEVCTDYHLLFREENTLYNSRAGFSDGCFRGQLLASVLRYKFNQYVSGHLVAEVFFPGDYYTDLRNDVSGFFRYELTFTW